MSHRARDYWSTLRQPNLLLLHYIISPMVRAGGWILMTGGDPFLSSVMARASLQRVLMVAGIIACLWLAIAWAVSLP